MEVSLYGVILESTFSIQYIPHELAIYITCSRRFAHNVSPKWYVWDSRVISLKVNDVTKWNVKHIYNQNLFHSFD